MILIIKLYNINFLEISYMKKICVTGANGFIGKALCKALNSSGKTVRGFVRTLDPHMKPSEIEYLSVGDISLKTHWKDKLKGYDCIIHCAGKAHLIHQKKDLDIYRLVNTDGTRYLAEQAAESGVKRFVFLSTVKVNGEYTGGTNSVKIFTNNDLPSPKDSYSVSKFEAEKILWNISSKTGLEVVVIRLPLVYGYSAPANIERLIKLINTGLPLPFSLVKNQRSLIGIDNLVDVIFRCIDHPNAKNKIFLVSDDRDLSTPDIIELIATSVGKSARLFPVPITLLKFLGFLIGRQSDINRLTGSLQVDIEYTKKTLDWKAPVSVYDGFKQIFSS